MLGAQNLTAEHFGGEQYNGCNDYLVISYPEAVEKVHRSFLEVGVDVLETDTFRSNRITMKEYGLQDRVLEINETAARLARRLADEYTGIQVDTYTRTHAPRNMPNLSPNPYPLTRFSFPRQTFDDHLCLADYFAPVASGKLDVVAFQVVTVGREATERFDKLQAAHDYTEAYFTHGLAVQTAEATAEYLHRHIRRELGLGEDQGKRYSWGYPAIPELEDHRKVFDLLPAVETELKMSLSPAYRLIPGQSTAAIIVHHKDARYYSVGESRVEQLMK